MFEFSDPQTFISAALPAEAEPTTSSELAEAVHEAANEENGFDFDGEPVCRACQLALNPNSLDESSSEKKLHNPYAHSCLSLTLNGQVAVDEQFARQYANIKSLYLFNKITIKNGDLFFAGFSSLKLLEIKDDDWTSLPKSLFDLSQLQSLKLINTAVRSFSDVAGLFQQLQSLENLHIDNLKIKKSKSLIDLPLGLKSFTITSLISNRIPFNLTSSLKQLTSIKLTGVPWIVNASNRVYPDQFRNDYMKYFSGDWNDLELFASYDKSNDGSLDNKELVRFNAFIFRHFERLGARRGGKKDPELTVNMPIEIFSIQSLQSIDLSFQAIKSIPDEIQQLVRLQTLILDNCILLASISPMLSNLPITQLGLSNCLSLKTPPPEIQRRGVNAIMKYLKRLMSGEVLFKRTKLMLVGLGEAGKTSLLNALRKGYSNSEAAFVAPQVTDGIDIKEWEVNLEDNTKLTYYMWDFAGQSVY